MSDQWLEHEEDAPLPWHDGLLRGDPTIYDRLDQVVLAARSPNRTPNKAQHIHRRRMATVRYVMLMVRSFPAIVDALESLLKFAHAALSDTVHDDNLHYYERKAYAALALTGHPRYVEIYKDIQEGL